MFHAVDRGYSCQLDVLALLTAMTCSGRMASQQMAPTSTRKDALPFSHPDIKNGRETTLQEPNDALQPEYEMSGFPARS